MRAEFSLKTDARRGGFFFVESDIGGFFYLTFFLIFPQAVIRVWVKDGRGEVEVSQWTLG